MDKEASPEIDDELFNDIYGKEYTGPCQSNANSTVPKSDTNKRPLFGNQFEEEDDHRDPNAVPTDFTSREAKVWEAKAKATERNWKKRKEEEMICKICGESGHFTQGCPSTLGANRKTAEFFERVPARDKNVRTLFSEKVISQIERDVGCKIKMDEKFLIVSGKDRLILSKGVDAVHKVIQNDKNKMKSPPKSSRSNSRSPDGSPKSSYSRHSESQRSRSSPRSTSGFSNRGFNQGKTAQDHVRLDRQKFARDSPQARAYSSEGGKGRSARSKSPISSNFSGDTFKSYDAHNLATGVRKTGSWNKDERHGVTSKTQRKFDFPIYSQTLEELEIDFQRELVELGRIRDQEEDEENYKHRECLREVRENYTKKLAKMRDLHRKEFDEFLELDMQRRQQAAQTTYSQATFTGYDQPARNMQYVGSGFSRNQYQFPEENYTGHRSRDGYSEFQLPRHEDFGKSYDRY